MKKIILIASLLGVILFQGCVDRDREKYDTFNGENNIYPVGKDSQGNTVFVKGVNINVAESAGEKISQTLYLYCDKAGNLLGSGPVSFTQQNGKFREDISVQ